MGFEHMEPGAVAEVRLSDDPDGDGWTMDGI
jgi:hypothetical protein